MYEHPYTLVKKIVTTIHQLEDKLMSTSFLPMTEQQKIHKEIKQLKEEMALLERRTRKS